MKTFIAFWLFFGAAAQALLAQASNYTAISNFGEQNHGVSDYINSSLARANPFVTGNTASYLSSVSLVIFGYFNGTSPGPVNVALYSDNADLPGSSIADLSGTEYPTNVGGNAYAYTPSSPVLLVANTIYWIVASSPGTQEGYYVLPLATTNALDPGSIWQIGTQAGYSGGAWFPDSDYLLFSVTAVPQTPTLAISAGAAAKTNIDGISNLGQPTLDDAGVNASESLAVSFTTGGDPADLSSISVAMNPVPPQSDLGTNYQPIRVSLYSDTNGTPGSSMAVLSGNEFPTNAEVYAYACTNSPALTLQANTRYWVVESAAGSTPFDWNLTTQSAVDSGSFWTLGVMEVNSGSRWELDAGYYPQFSVTATTPTLNLTYTSDFPFALQENSDLTIPNWLPATDVIQTSTNTNTSQTFFTVPSSNPQMFYRLGLQ